MPGPAVADGGEAWHIQNADMSSSEDEELFDGSLGENALRLIDAHMDAAILDPEEAADFAGLDAQSAPASPRAMSPIEGSTLRGVGGGKLEDNLCHDPVTKPATVQRLKRLSPSMRPGLLLDGGSARSV